MDVAISGASGFIGSALSASLRADGHRVLRLARGGVTSGDAIGWDPDAGRIDAPALEGVDAVVHLAGEGIGEKRWTDEQKREIRESRVRGTAVLAGAVASRERKPRVFVSGSAIGYYGDRGDEVLTEHERARHRLPRRGVRRVGSRDAAGERRRRAHRAHPHRHRARSSTAARSPGCCCRSSSGIGGRQGSGKQWMSWITLADHVGALRHAIDQRVGARPGQPRRAEPGHQRRVRATLGRRAAPADDPAHAVAPAEAALRRRARGVAAARRASGSSPPSCRRPATSSPATRRSMAAAAQPSWMPDTRVTEGTRTPGLRDHNPTL